MGVKDCSDPNVVTKYNDAGRIANMVLDGVISRCEPGATILDICSWGDNQIETQVS